MPKYAMEASPGSHNVSGNKFPAHRAPSISHLYPNLQPGTHTSTIVHATPSPFHHPAYLQQIISPYSPSALATPMPPMQGMVGQPYPMSPPQRLSSPYTQNFSPYSQMAHHPTMLSPPQMPPCPNAQAAIMSALKMKQQQQQNMLVQQQLLYSQPMIHGCSQSPPTERGHTNSGDVVDVTAHYQAHHEPDRELFASERKLAKGEEAQNCCDTDAKETPRCKPAVQEESYRESAPSPNREIDPSATPLGRPQSTVKLMGAMAHTPLNQLMGQQQHQRPIRPVYDQHSPNTPYGFTPHQPHLSTRPFGSDANSEAMLWLRRDLQTASKEQLVQLCCELAHYSEEAANFISCKAQVFALCNNELQLKKINEKKDMLVKQPADGQEKAPIDDDYEPEPRKPLADITEQECSGPNLTHGSGVARSTAVARLSRPLSATDDSDMMEMRSYTMAPNADSCQQEESDANKENTRPSSEVDRERSPSPIPPPDTKAVISEVSVNTVEEESAAVQHDETLEMQDDAPQTPFDARDKQRKDCNTELTGAVTPRSRASCKEKHPCIWVYGACRNPKTCIFCLCPANLCINWVRGACRSGKDCTLVHRLPEDTTPQLRHLFASHQPKPEETKVVNNVTKKTSQI